MSVLRFPFESLTATRIGRSVFHGLVFTALFISTCRASFLRETDVLNRNLQSLPTLDDIIQSESDLTTLAAAFQTASLDGVLSTTFNFTIFAPTNDAFAAVDQEFLATLLTPSWILHLQNLLTFHVTFPTVDRILSTDYVDQQMFDMLNNEVVTANDLKRGITLSSALTNASMIVEADLLASNGVLQKVDTVLSPGFFGVDVFGLGDRFTEFSILQELIDVIGLRGTEGEFTLLAPTNDAFEALGNDTLAALKEDTETLGKILANHVIVGVYPSIFLENGLVLESMGGLNITVTISEAAARQVASTTMFNDATVILADILAINGIAHAIDMVLLDPDTPSDVPSETPSDVPSATPSDVPSSSPTISPVPTGVPSAAPSPSPTISMLPSDVPSTAPSFPPSVSPFPSATPSDSPSDMPSESPSDAPSDMPSDAPSDTPSDAPSDAPSDQPSDRPTSAPAI